MECDVIVIGSGVSGLTTAVVLAESGQRVRVWCREYAPRTVSAVAGALWMPYRVDPRERVLNWCRQTYAALADLAGRPEETGVRLVNGLTVHPVAIDLPWWAEAVPADVLRFAPPEDLPPGFAAGLYARLPLVDMPSYLRYLVGRFEAAGGVIEQRTVASLDEAAGVAPVVVNCAGLGARELVPDPEVRPIQGQLVVVEDPGTDEWFAQEADDGPESLYMFPQPGSMILGGTAYADQWSTTPDPKVAEAILERCARIFPRLANARIIEHRIGLRPARNQVRLESERAPGETLHRIHNYGHGGAGVTVSWGCAREVAALAAAGA